MEKDLYKRTYYKYRSLTDLERFLDIIVNNRLYGAVYKELNDPMEGKFNKDGLNEDDYKNIYGNLKRTRVCSLLTKQDDQDFPNDYLMWSHYADSHKGCCIELQTTNLHNNELELVEVNYQDKLPMVEGDEKERIKKILSVKTSIWQNEHEVRAVRMYEKDKFGSQSAFYYIKVMAVYLGDRVPKEKCDFYGKIITSINPKIRVYMIREENSVPGFFPSLKTIELL